MSLLDLVQQQLGPQGTQQIAQQIGADPSTTNTAIQAAIPMLLGGMAGAARQPEGASAIQGMLGQSAGAGGIAGMLGGLLGGGGGGGLGGALGGGGGLGGMLGGLLGGQQTAVQEGVQQTSGLSGDQTKKLLMILAPIALAALAHQRQQRQQPQAGMGAGMGGNAAMIDSDGDGIPDHLEREARHAGAQAPGGIGGLVGKILDMAQRPPR